MYMCCISSDMLCSEAVEYRFDVCFLSYHVAISTIQITVDARNQR